jgi:hypothetical protein
MVGADSDMKEKSWRCSQDVVVYWLAVHHSLLD